MKATKSSQNSISLVLSMMPDHRVRTQDSKRTTLTSTFFVSPTILYYIYQILLGNIDASGDVTQPNLKTKHCHCCKGEIKSKIFKEQSRKCFALASSNCSNLDNLHMINLVSGVESALFIITCQETHAIEA